MPCELAATSCLRAQPAGLQVTWTRNSPARPVGSRSPSGSNFAAALGPGPGEQVHSVRSEPSPQGLQGKHLAGGYVSQADVGSEPVDEPSLLVLTRGLEDHLGNADFPGGQCYQPPGLILPDTAFGGKHADVPLCTSLSDHPHRAGLNVAMHLLRPVLR